MKNRTQTIVADSSAVSEYVAMASGCKKALFFRNLLDECNISRNPVIRMWNDNKSAIGWVNDDKTPISMEHLDWRYHFVKDVSEKRQISVQWKSSNENFADMFTKPLGTTLFQMHRRNIGVIDLTMI